VANELTRATEVATLGRTAARLARQVEVALQPFELSLAQYRILMQLSEGAEASSSLAEKLAVSAPSVTTVVDGLVSRNLVLRQHADDEDRRRVSHTITDEGTALAGQADEAVARRMEEIAAEIPDPVLAGQALDAFGLWRTALDAHRHRRRQERQAEAASRGRR
jgi:DNA-binding MarR family transcriptional regulator